MANPKMTLLDLLRKAEQGADPEFLRDGLKLLAQELMEAEVTQLVGAALHERSESRHADPPRRLPGAGVGHPGRHHRARYPQAAGRQLLPEPAGASAPARAGAALGGPGGLRERRQHRSVDALAGALGLQGISKDQVSRICWSWMRRSTPSGRSPWTRNTPT